MVGYGLDLSFWAGGAVFFIVSLGTAIPNAPGNVGSYQFFTIVGLTLFGVDKTFAAGFSMVVFVLLTLPLLILGSIAFSRSGLTLTSVQSRQARLTVAISIYRRSRLRHRLTGHSSTRSVVICSARRDCRRGMRVSSVTSTSLRRRSCSSAWR